MGTSSGKMRQLIPRGTELPAVVEETLSTYADRQPDIVIDLFEGDEQMVKHNHLVAQYLVAVQKAPRGVAQDANALASTGTAGAPTKATGRDTRRRSASSSCLAAGCIVMLALSLIVAVAALVVSLAIE